MWKSEEEEWSQRDTWNYYCAGFAGGGKAICLAMRKPLDTGVEKGIFSWEHPEVSWPKDTIILAHHMPFMLLIPRTFRELLVWDTYMDICCNSKGIYHIFI